MEEPTLYAVIETNTAGELSKRVECSIKQGWRPIGGVAMINDHDMQIWYAQAMVMGQASIV